MISAAALASLTEVPPWKMELVDARWWIQDRAGEGRKSITRFVDAYNSGMTIVAEGIEEARRVIPEISVATIYLWKKAFADRGLAGLVDRRDPSRGGGTVAKNEIIRSYILGLLFDHPHIRGGQIHNAIGAIDEESAALVSVKQIREWLNDWKARNRAIYEYASNPDAWKSKFKAAAGWADEQIVRLNQLWELDSTPADVMLTDGRHSILGVIDIWSRRLMLLVSKTSRAESVAALTRAALIAWGFPEAVRTDNGKDYVSAFYTGALQTFQVQQKLCIPFASEQKPFIERALGTFSHDVLEMLPGYIGHSVADRKAIESRKSFAARLMQPEKIIEASLSSAELQQFCNDWCEAKYGRRVHSSLGMSPFEKANSWQVPVKRLAPENERALDILLASGGTRVVQKKGVAIDGAFFIHAELGPLIGQQVQVKRDLVDCGRILVFTAEGKFVCIATNAERDGVLHTEVAAAMGARQRESMRVGKEGMKAARRGMQVEDIHVAIMEKARENAAKVRQLPRRAEVHSTPMIDGGVEAIAELDKLPAPTPVTHLAPRIAARKSDEDENDELWNRFVALRSVENPSDAERAELNRLRTTDVCKIRMQFENPQSFKDSADRRRSFA